ncbi:MAG: hypothetical protein PHU03_03855 [Syntrophales bacterium]|nr:hypothetical protein [Syntrophales bacterium]
MNKPLVALVHNVPVAKGSFGLAASMDVLDQMEAVGKALDNLEYPWKRIPFTRDFSAFVKQVVQDNIQIIFNLCETVDEEASLAAHPAAVFELMGIHFTGSPAKGLMLSTDKATAKLLMAASGIKTPAFIIHDGTVTCNIDTLSLPVIVKPRFEDASIGIDQESVFEDKERLMAELPVIQKRFGSLIVEEYIGGREFNVSLFGYPVPATLPVAEIDFSSFPETTYPILGYRAKWDASSFEYHNSPRVFPDHLPPSLLRSLEAAALECFRLFHLRDYGRVDMRVASGGDVYVLEVNANPCLAPDAGFAAAIEQAGISYAEMVDCIVSWAQIRDGSS